MLLFSLITLFVATSIVQARYESVVNFRIEPGVRTCFFEKGKFGQMLEIQYQVTDGQRGDLDVSVDIVDPKGVKIISDYKRSQNSIILDLEEEGDYSFCMDNTHSIINSKLVFVYVLVEEKAGRDEEKDVEVAVLEGGLEHAEEEVLEWMGTDEAGASYYIEVGDIARSLTRTLNHVVKARHLLDFYGALRSRDSYLAFKETFIVDAWSLFQITFMCIVGLVQVYMIKNLFSGTVNNMQRFY